jgi:alpha-1,2-mannosyltransferase
MALWLPAAVCAVPVWLLLTGWNKQGIDFSVYWHGGKIL